MSILTERLEYPPVGGQILKVASMPFNTSTGLSLSARGIDIYREIGTHIPSHTHSSKQVAHYMGEYAQKQFRKAQRSKESFNEMTKIAKFATDFVSLVRDARELDSGELVLDPCLESRAQVYLRGKDRDLFIECLDEAVGWVAPEKRAKVAYHLHGLIASVPDLMGLAEALVRDARELDSGELVLDPCLESRAQVYLRGKDRDLFIECLDEAVGRVAPEKRAKVAYHLHGLIAPVPTGNTTESSHGSEC